MRKLFVLVALPAIALAIYDMEWFDLNRWRCPFYNDGRWGIDFTVGGGEAGGSWPEPFRNMYIFGAGPWIGCIDGNDTLVSICYNPNSGGTEMCPCLCRYWRQGTGDSLDRIYKYPGDWPPPQSRFPMAPQNPKSEMDLWCAFSDSDPANHIAPGRPIGLDVALTVYGFSDSIAKDFFFLKYELFNIQTDPIEHVYLGMTTDPDVGQCTDDMTGLILDKLFRVGSDTIRIRNVGFAYDYDNREDRSRHWEQGTPGAVAIRLLSAPGTTALSAFKRFTIDIDPTTDPTQYLTLAGYNYRTGLYEPFDSIDQTPADKRFTMATGPFDIPAQSSVTLWYAVIGSPFGDSAQPPHERDTTELALRCYWAEQVFLGRLAVAEPVPTPQPVPAITLRPNPFCAASPLRISSPDQDLKVRIYARDGVLVSELEGRSLLTWDGTDTRGRKLPAGVYFLESWAGHESRTAKVLLLKN